MIPTMDDPTVIDIHIGKRRLIPYAFLKPDGSPGPIDGPPEIETTDAAVIAPLDNRDQKSFYVRCVGAGLAQVIIRADVDLGAGVKMLEKALAFRGLDVMDSQVQTTVGEEEDDPDFDGNNHTDPLPAPVSTEPAPEPSDPAGGGAPSGTGEPPPAGSTVDQGGTAAPSGAGDAGPTPPAPGDAGAAQQPQAGGGEGPQVGTTPVAGT
jgi:hypothetical protein